ncbi:MAG: TRAP transporter substrate-binding protein DctP [Geminicoccaceae bacterium]|jgi:tripartite ATP-independent transporter DctP family solute receptor|nr:TRAP transporter substrate-binding protein DctP [Geminicoccaceae bacterium]HRY25636.1 TRAP transporter substrate-binding protein DctP [Geminicoccaceae bacterium]
MTTKTLAGTALGRRRALALGAAAAAAPFAVRLAGAQEAKLIRISTPGSAEETLSKSLFVFKEQLEQHAPGTFNVELHFNATLFGQGMEIPAMQRGNLEAAMISPQDIAEQLPEYSIFTAGYLIQDRDHLERIFAGEVGDEVFARVAEDMGVEILGTQYHGQRHLVLREPKEVNTPADLAGMKLRVPGSESWRFLGAALGGNPTPIAFDEVYLALKTGTVDAVEQPLSDMISAKFYEVTEQLVLTGHLVSTLFFGFSKPFIDSLTDEQRAQVQAAADAAATWNNDQVSEIEKGAVDFLVAQGMTATTPDLEAFRTHVLDEYLNSDFSANWPEGMLEKINNAA